MVGLLGYIDDTGGQPFQVWFDNLDGVAAAKVTIALTRIEQGHFSNVKGVGAGVYEYKIDFGPGYRIYFGKDGERIVILLGVAPRSASHRTLRRCKNAGPTTNVARKKETDAWPSRMISSTRFEPVRNATRRSVRLCCAKPSSVS